MVHIRRIREHECGALLALLKESAQQRGRETDRTAAGLHRQLFLENTLKAYVADLGTSLGGYCLYCDSADPFSDRSGYTVLDEYVQPDCRHGGLGKGFLQTLGMIALDEGKGFLQWNAAPCSDRAAAFYTEMGAQAEEGGRRFVVQGGKLEYFTAHCACHRKA